MLQYTNRVPVVGDKVYLLDPVGKVDKDYKGSIVWASEDMIGVEWGHDESNPATYYPYELVFAE